MADLGAGDGLLVGDDRQDFHRGLGERFWRGPVHEALDGAETSSMRSPDSSSHFFRRRRASSSADCLIAAHRIVRTTTGRFHPSSPDREGFKKLFRMLIAAFPDLKFVTDFMVAEGDRVSAFTSVQGTHRGEFMGIPPTGKSFSVNNADTCRFTSDGLICEHWGIVDVAAMMRQLGVGA